MCRVEIIKTCVQGKEIRGAIKIYVVNRLIFPVTLALVIQYKLLARLGGRHKEIYRKRTHIGISLRQRRLKRFNNDRAIVINQQQGEQG